MPDAVIHPAVFAIKKMLLNLNGKKNFLLYCDLHGHTKLLNSFIYGCNTAANAGFSSWTKVRLFPRILAH